ncbi:MAG: hypothetical protein ACUVR4_05680 [Anaerolineae bacterium]
MLPNFLVAACLDAAEDLRSGFVVGHLVKGRQDDLALRCQPHATSAQAGDEFLGQAIGCE